VNLLLDGSTIRSMRDFHEAVRAASGIDFYGDNLDALWDLLIGLVERPVRIVWIHAAQSETAMGEDFARIVDVIRNAATEFPDDDFRFELSL
jgi:RNAse (barnase) inhibitor barstar